MLNGGTIMGNVDLDAGADVFQGLGGTILGDLLMGAGADHIDLRGAAVSGAVDGGADDDAYVVDDATLTLVEATAGGTDTVQSFVSLALAEHFENLMQMGADDIDGTGNDAQNTMTGNAGSNMLFGAGSRDTIDGGAGADDIDGGRGDDVVSGGDGDDMIAGRAGLDLLEGGEGEDYLFGGLADDTLDGGAGNDTLKGGYGQDEMTGGSEADVFVFCRSAESPSTSPDRITDFEAGVDRLDLSALVQGMLDLNPGISHTGGGTASVFLSVTGAGNTQVYADANGDGVSDMRIVLLGTSGLTEADLLL